MGTIKCPKCAKRLKFADELSGKRAKCPGCGQILILPDETKGGCKCPFCGVEMTPQAVLCVQCGYDLRTQKTLGPYGHKTCSICSRGVPSFSGAEYCMQRGKLLHSDVSVRRTLTPLSQQKIKTTSYYEMGTPIVAFFCHECLVTDLAGEGCRGLGKFLMVISLLALVIWLIVVIPKIPTKKAGDTGYTIYGILLLAGGGICIYYLGHRTRIMFRRKIRQARSPSEVEQLLKDVIGKDWTWRLSLHGDLTLENRAAPAERERGYDSFFMRDGPKDVDLTHI